MEAADERDSDDAHYQWRMLPRVSRTFALTVPQLPEPLDGMVANAYLLCRIADTVEDDSGLGAQAKGNLLDLLPRVVESPAAADFFAVQAHEQLTRATPAAERDLAVNVTRVARVTRTLPQRDRNAVTRCLAQMCHGMDEYGRREGPGLRDLDDLQRYCHYVAGVVGEMLTEMFCNHGKDMQPRRAEMLGFADSFGQGLQLTNILKDVWEDLAEGRCWLPRTEFEKAGYDLAALSPNRDRGTFDAVMTELVAVAHSHLRNALRYTLLVPVAEGGIRRFCLWSIGLALSTLKRIHATPGYASGQAVKVPRRAVTAIMASASVAGRFDNGPSTLFEMWSRGLPRRPVRPAEAVPVFGARR